MPGLCDISIEFQYIYDNIVAPKGCLCLRYLMELDFIVPLTELTDHQFQI
jgi:hypothetical protein